MQPCLTHMAKELRTYVFDAVILRMVPSWVIMAGKRELVYHGASQGIRTGGRAFRASAAAAAAYCGGSAVGGAGIAHGGDAE